MESKKKKYNLDRLQWMEQEINDYLNKKISLIQLIDNLYILINDIELSSDFFKKFISSWSILEINFAIASADNRTYFTPLEILRINQGIDEIKNLIIAYKNII